MYAEKIVCDRVFLSSEQILELRSSIQASYCYLIHKLKNSEAVSICNYIDRPVSGTTSIIRKHMRSIFWLVIAISTLISNAVVVRGQTFQTTQIIQEELETCKFNDNISFAITLSYGIVAIIVLIGVSIWSYNQMRYNTSKNEDMSNMQTRM